MRHSSNETYNSARTSLLAKKQKLFESRNIEKWGTKSSEFKEPVEEVLRNFNVAEKYILPREGVRVERLKELSEFLNNTVYYEYVLFNKRDQRRIVKNFHQYAKKVGRATRNNDTIWNIFERLGVDENNPADAVGRGPTLHGAMDSDQILSGLEADLNQVLGPDERGRSNQGQLSRGFLD